MRVAALLVATALFCSRSAFATEPYELARWSSEQPQSLALTPQGTILVAGSDFGGGNGWVIREFSPSGQIIRTIPGAANCSGSFYGDDLRVAPAPNGGVYTYSPQCGQAHLSRLDAQGGLLWSVVLQADNRFDDMCVDNAGNVLISDAIQSKIRRFDPSGNSLGLIDLNSGWPTTNVAGIAVDGSGQIWAASWYGATVLVKATAAGVVLDYWELPNFGTIDAISGMSCNGSDRVYVGLQIHNSSAIVCEFDTTGTLLRSWNSWGPGVPGNGSFTGYADVAADAGGNIYVADRYAWEVHRFVDSSAPAPQVTANGVTNTGLGSALLQSTPGGQVILSNIGSSGNDGVSFPAPDADNGRTIDFGGGLPIDPAVDDGASLVAEITGTAAGDAASLGKLRFDVVADGMDITPDLSALGTSNYKVEAFANGELVHSCEVPAGTVLHRSSPSSSARKTRYGTQAAGDGIEGVQVGLKKRPGGQLQVGVTFTGNQTVNIAGTPVAASKIQITALAPKQPIVAATAVLKVARPAGSAKFPNTHTATDNFATVSIAGEPPAVDVNGEAGGGLHVEPTGAAAFPGGAMDDGAVVNNIGSSGNDGVDVWLDKSTGATHNFADEQGFNTATDAGAWLEHKVRGKLGCNPDSVVAIVRETVYPDSIVLKPDFSKTGVTGQVITISSNGAVVHSASYPPDRCVTLVTPLSAPIGTNAASINTSRSNLKDKASITTAPTVTVVYKRPGSAGFASRIGSEVLAMPFDFKIGSNHYQGDEVEFAPVGGVAVPELTGASFKQKNPGVPHLATLALARPGVAVANASASNVSKGKGAMLAVGGKLVVHNIGSSGNDGVSVRGAAPASTMGVKLTRVPTASAMQGGAFLRMASRGRRVGDTDAHEVLAVKASKVGGQMRFEPTALQLSAKVARPETNVASYRLEVFNGNVVVGSVDAAAPQADAARMPDQLNEGAQGPAFEGSWDTPLSIAVVGGPTVVGNRIRIKPLGAPDDVLSLEALDIDAANIPTFELGNWSSPSVIGVSPGVIASAVQLAVGRNPVFGNGRLECSLELPVAGWVDLDLYDAHGRKTWTGFHGMLPAGTTSRTWEARGVTSGVYFLRMASLGQVRTDKIVFVR